MTLVAHLVRADVRRFRLLLAAWVLVEIADTVFTGVQPLLTGDSRASMTIGLLAMVLFFTRWLGMIVIVALVVQTHPLVGSDAFWMTRPIPPRALFASKVLSLATTFLAVPALCVVVLMAAFRVPVEQIVLVAIQTILFQSLWVAIVMALSAMTRNLARFVLVAGALLVSLMALGIGFPIGIVGSLVVTLFYKWTGLAPDDFSTATHNLTGFISNPDVFSFTVAFAAGIVGMLSLTNAKSGALIGVLISVTTIPAASNIGVAAAYGDWGQAGGAAAQLGINLTAIVLAGVLTLLVQRHAFHVRKRRHERERSA